MVELLERIPEHLRSDRWAVQLDAYRRADEVAAARRATGDGIVDEVAPEVTDRVMASMAEEFAAADSPTAPARPPVTMADMIRLQRRMQRQARAERQSMFEQLAEQWRLERLTTWMRRGADPVDAIRGGE